MCVCAHAWRVYVCVCVRDREKERKRETGREGGRGRENVHVCAMGHGGKRYHTSFYIVTTKCRSE